MTENDFLMHWARFSTMSAPIGYRSKAVLLGHSTPFTSSIYNDTSHEIHKQEEKAGKTL